MLYYQDIYDMNQANERLKHDRYNSRWSDKAHSRDADLMYAFTYGPKAKEQSLANLEMCLRVARELEISTLVIKPQQIQVAGDIGSGRHELAAKGLFPQQWLKQHEKWLDSSYPQRPQLQDTDQGESMEFYTWRRCLCLFEHQGVYDTATGERIKNRKAIIERFWSLGFATQRGRPPSIARLKYTGTREELQELNELADRYWTRGRRRETEMSKKIVSVYRSINRYAAWPGAW